MVGLLVGEEHGGAGMGMVDAAVVLEELGRAVCPAPYASSAIGAVSLADDELLAALADGSTIGTVAIFEAGSRYLWQSPATRGDATARRLATRRRQGARRRRDPLPTSPW